MLSSKIMRIVRRHIRCHNRFHSRHHWRRRTRCSRRCRRKFRGRHRIVQRSVRRNRCRSRRRGRRSSYRRPGNILPNKPFSTVVICRVAADKALSSSLQICVQQGHEVGHARNGNSTSCHNRCRSRCCSRHLSSRCIRFHDRRRSIRCNRHHDRCHNRCCSRFRSRRTGRRMMVRVADQHVNIGSDKPMMLQPVIQSTPVADGQQWYRYVY